MFRPTRLFWIYSLTALIAVGILSYRTARPSQQTASILVPDDTQPVNPPEEVHLVGQVSEWMTYGRILVKNQSPNSAYTYFIADPDDAIASGALRYSPTTDKLTKSSKLNIAGKMTSRCYWDDSKYGGCVPWVEIVSLKSD